MKKFLISVAAYTIASGMATATATYLFDIPIPLRTSEIILYLAGAATMLFGEILKELFTPVPKDS